MKKLYIALALLVSGTALGQIEQNVNKTTGTVSNAINDIDSIRFNGTQTEMQIVLTNGTVVNHAISEINNVTFTPLTGVYPAGTVHCGGVASTVVDVTNPITGKTWMDRNLGASQVATSSTDELAYGDLYQWGRRADGHQCRSSPTTETLSSVDQPAHGDFILNVVFNVEPMDWRSPQNDNLWQGVNGINNPCPSGYRLPTEVEQASEVASWSSQNSEGAFSSILKLTLGGARNYGNGGIDYPGVVGQYGTSTVSGVRITITSVNWVVTTPDVVRGKGCTVRCIKD